MSHKTKYSPEFKISVARRCIEGSLSLRSAAKEVGTSSATIHKWVTIYRFQGEYGFFPVEKNRVYSEDFRLRAVLECINEHSSPIVVAAKYGIRSCSRLEEWIKMYNNGEDFSHKMSGGSRMKTSRSTTKEERIQIVHQALWGACGIDCEFCSGCESATNRCMVGSSVTRSLVNLVLKIAVVNARWIRNLAVKLKSSRSRSKN